MRPTPASSRPCARDRAAAAPVWTVVRPSHRVARAAAAIVLCATFLSLPLFMVLGSLRLPGLPPPDGWEWIPDPLWWDNYGAVTRFLPGGGPLLGTPMWSRLPSRSPCWSPGGGFAIATSTTPPSLGRHQRSRTARSERRVVGSTVHGLPVARTDGLAARGGRASVVRHDTVLRPPVRPGVLADPPNLFEAARVEGLSSLRTWWLVAVPLGRSAMFAVVMLAVHVPLVQPG